ncbi:hypothetical protein Micbo1qcDRAFT_141544 [Microdochium bolleyi]|uniref:Zn(2)-C6 fungal-type domain-containing protein n=1 Tax=Microdochium bolleyi TaxID=196109 RepID=A0A136IKI0_9PEZI|nr:hypothetical protein Micbo1qcDRAFT_141544 [Microdochium bolleyi]
MSSAGQSRAVSRRAANSTASRTPVRAPNACERCRKQKIRCSGSQPCDACRKRSLPCHFDESHQRVVVTKGFIRELQRKASCSGRASHYVIDHDTVQGEVADGPASPYMSPAEDDETSTSPPARCEPPPRVDNSSSRTERNDPVDSEPHLTNLLAQNNSKFMTAGNGMTYYLGASSNWTFTQRVLSMVYERVFQNRIPDVDRFIEGLGNAYDLQWNGLPMSEEALSAASTVPTIDHAIYLINAVKFHCGQLLHVFDEEAFLPALYAFYEQPPSERQQSSDPLWFVHFLLILAFGKAFTVRKRGKDPAGVEYFMKALQLLPNIIMLWRHPVHAIEVLTCIALYLQCLDYRILAHNFIGQALRLALNYGIHTDVSKDGFGGASVERIRRVWWTLYILDREMTCVSGLPQAVQSDDVHCQLPEFAGSPQRVVVLKMQLSLSQLMANINKTVYGVGGKLNRDFQKGIESSLAEVARVHEELYKCFPLPPEQASGGISRTSAHLYLAYYRCILLATRPILFCFLKIRLDSRQDCQTKLHSSATSRSMIQMCLDASIQTLVTLELLLEQNLIDSFLPFDLDSVSAATVNVLVAMALDPSFVEKGSPWITTADSIFNDLAASGNQVAAVRQTELNQIKSLLAKLEVLELEQRPPPAPRPRQPQTMQSWTLADDQQPPVAARGIFVSPGPATILTSTGTSTGTDIASMGGISSEGLVFGANTGFSFDLETGDPSRAAEIIELASSIGDLDPRWVSDIIGHDSIW